MKNSPDVLLPLTREQFEFLNHFMEQEVTAHLTLLIALRATMSREKLEEVVSRMEGVKSIREALKKAEKSI